MSMGWKYLKLFPKDQQRAVDLYRKVKRAQQGGPKVILGVRDVDLLNCYTDYLGESRVPVEQAKIRIKR